MSCFSLVMQLSGWFDELKRELQSNDVADTVEQADELIEHFAQQKQATTQACDNTISEGHNLLQQLL